MIGWLPSFIGRALRSHRAGMSRTLYHDAALAGVPSVIRVQSSDFAPGGALPRRHSADGQGICPALSWQGVPEAARSVVVVVEDADSPTASPIVHLLIDSLPPVDGSFATGGMDKRSPGLAGRVGRNSLMRRRWAPPDPPPGHGAHRYLFQVFALDHMPESGAIPGWRALVGIVRQRAVAKGAIEGHYERS